MRFINDNFALTVNATFYDILIMLDLFLDMYYMFLVFMYNNIYIYISSIFTMSFFKFAF